MDLNINNMQAASSPQPLISVVVATYNGARYIREQLDSILHQTYPNIEVVITDDRSTDETMSILEEYAVKYSNVRVYQNETNLKYVKNFEKGMRLATGAFIAPSDQDDVWELDKLQVLMDQIGDHAIIYCNSELIDANGNFLGKKMSDIRKQMTYSSCLMFVIGSWAPGHAMLIRSSLVHKAIPFPDYISHDIWMSFISAFTMPVKYHSQPLVRYRQHPNNLAGGFKVEGRIKQKEGKEETMNKIRARVQIMYERCPQNLEPEKSYLKMISVSYHDFSIANNFKRMKVFFKHRKELLAYKGKTEFGSWLFCLKMFFKII